MDWNLAIVAAVLLWYSLLSGRLAGTPITAAIVFVFSGLMLGDEVLGVIDVPAGDSLTPVLAEATLALVLFADASRIDLRALRVEFAVPARLLGIGLPLTILAGFGIALLLFDQLLVAEALVLAVILAPTDAALGQAVVSEPSLPSRIRQGLNVESGLNDGICVPLLVTTLAVAESESGDLSARAALTVLVEELGYGLLCGVLAGAAVAALLNGAARRRLVDPGWLQVAPVAGAALAYGIATPIGGSGFIAAFAGGVVYGRVRQQGPIGDRYLLEEGGEVLSALTFLLFGAVVLGAAIGEASWEVVVYAALSLTVVRMVPVAVAMAGTGARVPTLAFLGWFGPRGLASIVFAALVLDEANLPHSATIVDAAVVTVGLSVLLHGLTAAPLAARYAAWFRSHPRGAEPAMESVRAPALPWRRSLLFAGGRSEEG